MISLARVSKQVDWQLVFPSRGDVITESPGILNPAMLGKEEPEAPKGMLFATQDFAGIKWR